MKNFDINPDLIEKLSKILDKNNLTEIELSQGEQSIRVARQQQQSIVTTTQAAPIANQGTTDAAPQANVPSGNAIASPMVGTAYLAPSPDASNFVSVGDKVNNGDTLLIIEAMKVMNQIKATDSGTVKAILVSNEEPVEFGQDLIIIE